MIEVNQRIVLHLAVAAIAGAILVLILQRELYPIVRAILAH